MTGAAWPSVTKRAVRNDGGGRRGRGSRGKSGLAPLASVLRAPGEATFKMTALLLAAALLFGGASRENALQLVGLELLSLPAIALAASRLGQRGAADDLKAPLVLLGLMAALPLLQLVPIPFEVWRHLPGREEIAQGLLLAGAAPAYLPLSLTPETTLAAALTLLIPAGVFLGASACSRKQQKLLAALVILGAGVSLLLGLLQVADGSDSPLRFYASTNPDVAVGLFANRNHHAIFLLLALPLIAMWLSDLSAKRGRQLPLLSVAALALFGVILVSVAITRSRAGFVLTLPAVAGSLLILWNGRMRQRMRATVAGFAAVAIASLTAIGLLALDAILERFDVATDEAFRTQMWPSVREAANHYSPVGAGLDSFSQLYRAVEPLNLMGAFFVNQAHNEYLQVWFELGLAAAIVGVAFFIWIASRAVRAWQGRDNAAAQAATIVVGLLIMHSVVDYPTRTPAIMAVLGLSCALLARRRRSDGGPSHSKADQA